MNHRLTLVDRGPEHRHQFWATCACGWDSVPCRRRREAERRYRLHVSQQSDGKRARGRLLSRMRRAPTPHRQLPEELRADNVVISIPTCVCGFSMWCPIHGWAANLNAR